MIRILVLGVLVLFFTSFQVDLGHGMSIGHGKKAVPIAEHGILDLSHWNFTTDGPIAMSGQWKFFWQTFVDPSQQTGSHSSQPLIQVPGSWNSHESNKNAQPGQGFATFRLRVTLPETSQDLGIKFLDMATAFTAYVNGHEIVSSGMPGKTRSQSIPAYSPGVVSIPVQYSNQNLDILIHVSNFHHWQGGMWEPVTIGRFQDLIQAREKRIFMDALLFGSILIMGIYHLFLYRFRRQDKSALYFGLFCLVVAIRPITHGERYLLELIPEMPWDILLKMVYLSLFSCTPLFSLYVLSLFPKETPAKAVYAVAWLGFGICLAILFLPPQVFTPSILLFQGGTLILLAYGTIVLIKATINKRQGAGIFLAGFLVFFLSICNDILYTHQLIHTGHFVPLGLFAFILCQAILLAKRFSQAFHLVTRQQHELETEMVQRLRIESDLINSEKRFRQMADFLPIPLCETDNHRNIVYANKACLGWFGYSKEEMATGLSLSVVWPKSNIIQSISMEQSALEGKEFSLVRKNDSRVWAQVETVPIIQKEGLQGYRICFVDLTERKRAEEASIYAAEQEKYALVGQVAGKMAHDFNNILGAVMGNAELSLLDCKERDTLESLEIILEQSKRGQILTQNLVAFAKDQDPQEDCFNLNQKMDLVLNLLKKDLQGIQLVKNYADNLPDLVADSGMIEQILINLFQNAIHAMGLEPHPQLKITTGSAPQQIYVEISDNGCGIPEKYHSHIYTPSFTLKGSKDKTGSYASEIKGTGYGMANVKKYMEKHNGQISFTSIPKPKDISGVGSSGNSGTTFTLRLPLIEQKTPSPGLKARKMNRSMGGATGFSGKTILIVEDEDAISKVFKNILTHPPFNNTISIARDGKAAMTDFDDKAFDLVSLDYVLPGDLNGLDVYHHIRKKNPLIPIVFVSGNLEFIASVQELFEKDPYLDHLTKPCENVMYARTIEKWIV